MKMTIRIAGTLGVLLVLAIVLPWSEVRTAVGRMSASVWLGVLLGFLAGHQLGVLKWRLIVNTGRGNLGIGDAVRCYAAGLFANLCLPSIVGGDVLRATLAGKATRRPEAAVLGGVADRLIDLFTLGSLIAVGGLLAGQAVPGWGWRLVTLAIVLGGVVAAVAAPWLVRRPLSRWPARLRRPVGRSLVAWRRVVRNPRAAAAAFVMSLAIQAGFVLLNAWIGAAVGIHIDLAVWFLVWPLAKLAGLLPISLGGLGVRDATLGALMVPLGVAPALGVVASLIWQSVLIAGGLIGGAIWWIGKRRHPASVELGEFSSSRIGVT